MDEQTHFINGQWLGGAGQTLSSYNPANGECLWQGKTATPQQIQQAITSARIALPHWSGLSLNERLTYLQTFCQLLEKNHDALAQTISQEVGKPLWEARTEVQAMINKLAISVEAYQERTGSQQQSLATSHSMIKHKANGVFAVLGPFNFPGHLPNGHIMPALLAGNTIVFKPSELTPKVAEQVISYWQQSDIPDGVINLIQGGRDGGEVLISSDINGVLFTGSYRTGQQIHQQLAGQPEKLLALEMGGNNPLVVWDTKDMKAAAYHIIQSAFLTSGQRCTCARRLIISQDSAADALLNTLTAMTKTIHIGPYTASPEPFMGPLISTHAAEQVLNTQQALITSGATVLLEASQLALGDAFVSPGIIDVTKCEHRNDEEVFGPLLQVIRCPDFASAITEANNTRYGLSAGLISESKSLFDQFYQQVNAGLINWNQALTGAASQAPFGGTGCSGNHRPSAYYAADYCAYPVASLMSDSLTLPTSLTPGIHLED